MPLGCSDVFSSSVRPRQVLPSVSPPPAVSRCGAWSVSGSQNPEFGLGSGQAMEDAVKKKREERSEPIKTIQGQVALDILGAGPNDVPYNRVSPVVENTLEMVSPVVDSVKTKMEEQELPQIPTKSTETVQTYQEAAVEQVIANIEKVDVDTIACGGIDRLTENVPQLKDAAPKLIEETKSSVLRILPEERRQAVTACGGPKPRSSESCSQLCDQVDRVLRQPLRGASLVALKVVDVSQVKVEEALKKIDS